MTNSSRCYSSSDLVVVASLVVMMKWRSSRPISVASFTIFTLYLQFDKYAIINAMNMNEEYGTKLHMDIKYHRYENRFVKLMVKSK